MQTYYCKNCGAVLYWDASHDCLKCQFCDEEYQITDFEDKSNTDQEVKSEALDKEYVATETTDDMSVYECKTCGGEVVAMNTTMATVCPYCGEAISITSKTVGDFRPELVIPFKNKKKEAEEIYRNYVNKSFLTPKEFKEDNLIEKIQGLFTPFQLHTICDTARHSFKGEKVSSHKSGYDKVDTHKVYNLSITADAKFDKLPTDASKKIENELMDALEPFNYADLKDYNPAYMAGFIAEQRDEEPEAMEKRALDRCKTAMDQKARQAFTGYSSVSQQSENHNITSHEQNYAMLPVWILNVKHGGQNYKFAINGQTGKVVGKLPVDKAKLIKICAACFGVAEILVTTVMMFM